MNLWSRRYPSAFACACLLWWSWAAFAFNPPYLAEIPAVERVLADTQGRNPLDTKARQVAALVHVRKAIEDLGIARMVSGYLPDEKRLIGEYWTAVTRLQEEAKELTGPPAGADAPWAKWLALEGRYERSAEMRAETLTRYLSPQMRMQLNITNARTDARVRESNAEMLEGLGVEVSTWDAMDPEAQQTALGFAFAAAVLLCVFGAREFRRFGLLSSDPLTIRAGFRTYAVHHFTGTVTRYARWTESEKTTTTTTEASGARSTSVSYRSWEHESFTLVSERDAHDVHVVNAEIFVENGSLVSAVWAIRAGAKEGDHVLFFDRTNKQTRPVRQVLQAMFSPTRWLMLPVLMIAMVVSANTGVLLGLLPRTNGLLRGFIGIFAAWVFMLGTLGLVGRYRGKRFVKRDGPRLLESIVKCEHRTPSAGQASAAMAK